MHILRNSLPAKRRQLISLTPLIDVVFILLIFFMLASSFLDWRTITLNTPGQAATVPDMEGAMLVRLHADGTLDMAGEALSGDQLQARLQAAVARKPGQRVLVRPERGVAMQRAVEVLDLVASAGIMDVSLVRGR